MNAAKKEDNLWVRIAKIVRQMHPSLADYRVRMVAREKGLRLWAGSDGEMDRLIERAQDDWDEDEKLFTKDFKRDQVVDIDPLPGHHLIVMEKDDHRVILNVLSWALEEPRDVSASPWAITRKEVEDEILSESYATSDTGRTVLCEITTHNGTVYSGTANCIHVSTYDYERGAKAARERALSGIYIILSDRKRDLIVEDESHP